jgi:hypothetical protein
MRRSSARYWSRAATGDWASSRSRAVEFTMISQDRRKSGSTSRLRPHTQTVSIATHGSERDIRRAFRYFLAAGDCPVQLALCLGCGVS